MKPVPEDQNRPADMAAPDSVGGMARRLMNPAHLRELAARGAATLKQQGAEQLWRDVTFRVGLALHHDGWRHRAGHPPAPHPESPAGGGSVRAHHLGGGAGVQHPHALFPADGGQRPAQTYRHWQLVLMDASDADHPAPGACARRLAAKDSRILYQKIENRGIAENTTAGFAAATGDAIALLDHDDLLYPNALYECARALNAGADFVYSDEIVLSANLKQLGGYHFKPDFAPDYLRGCNYITHLAVFTRPLLEAAGAAEYREFDGAQDHDLFLRPDPRKPGRSPTSSRCSMCGGAMRAPPPPASRPSPTRWRPGSGPSTPSWGG